MKKALIASALSLAFVANASALPAPVKKEAEKAPTITAEDLAIFEMIRPTVKRQSAKTQGWALKSDEQNEAKKDEEKKAL